MDTGSGSSRHIQAVSDQAFRDQGSGANGARRPIGDIFVELGFISRAELDAALDVQRATGGRIGEILVAQGSLSRIDLASALAEHWEPHPHPDDNDALRRLLDAAARPATDLAALQPEPSQKPRRGRLRRSPGREEELADQLAELEARLRADQARASADYAQALTFRLDRIESRIEAIDGLEARLGAVSELAAELRGEVTALAQQTPPVDPSERLLELSLRIDSAARDSHDRIGALAAELRTEAAVKSAGLEVRLDAQLVDATELQRRLAEVQAAALATEVATAELHVEIGSLAGRLDELMGLRHADAQVARVANERLGTRLERLIEQQGDEAARAAERAVLEGLGDLGRELAAMASKHGKPGKGLRRAIAALAAAIDALDARLAEQGGALSDHLSDHQASP